MRTSARDRPELELVIERPSRALRRARLPERQPPDAPGTIGRRSVDPRHLRPAGAKGCRTQCVLARVYAGSRPAKDPTGGAGGKGRRWLSVRSQRPAGSSHRRTPTHSGGGRPYPAVRSQGETAALGTRTRSRFLKCVHKSMSSGHGAGWRRSTSQATPAPPTETCGHDSRSDTGSAADGRPVKQGHPVFQKRPSVPIVERHGTAATFGW